MKKILLSYFAPFAGIDTNSSAEIAKKIAFPNVTKIGLKVVYKTDFIDLQNAYNNGNFDLVIMLGQARGREKITLESRATNLNNPKAPDNDGCLPEEEIVPENAHYLYTKLNLDAILAALECENVAISKNAGSYLCNYVYYNALAFIDKTSLFIHLPSFTHQTDDARIPTLEIDEMASIINKLLKLLSEGDYND